MADKLVIALAGTKFHDAKLFPRDLPPQTPLRLVREPDNPYDANAIAVWVLREYGAAHAPAADERPSALAWKLGMIPARSGSTNWAARLTPLMDGGKEFRAEVQQHHGIAIVVRLFAPEGIDFDALAERAA